MRVFLLFFLMQPVLLQASDRDEVMGRWASDASIFEIMEAEGVFLGVIQVLKDPTYTLEENAERVGEIRTDDENPDPALRSRSIVGISMFSEYEYDDGRWRGRIYDPKTGNTYQSRMEVDADGQLKIRGYIGMPMFGRTAIFDRVSTCKTHIKEMLSMLNDNSCEANE